MLFSLVADSFYMNYCCMSYLLIFLVEGKNINQKEVNHQTIGHLQGLQNSYVEMPFETTIPKIHLLYNYFFK